MPVTEDWVLRVIRRPEAHMAPGLMAKLGRVLITGGEGSIGSALAEVIAPKYLDHRIPRLPSIADAVLLTDIHTMDVRDERNVMAQFLRFEPDVVVHLAASKHAPLGEEDPYEVVRTNVEGTRNILEWSRRMGARCVVASTCKAADPETAYGASKLIAERMALNAGQAVARYYNVVETSGNVFEIWRREHDELNLTALPFTPCKRRFITLNEALSLTLWVASWGNNARYTLTDVVSTPMEEILKRAYPDATGWETPPRRGDRIEEPRCADCERMTEVEGCEWISRITNPHDPLDREEQ